MISPNRQIYAILTIPPIFLGVLYLFSTRLYLLAVLEDQILEQLQVSALIGTMVLAYMQSRQAGPRQNFFSAPSGVCCSHSHPRRTILGQRFLRFASLPGSTEPEIEADIHNHVGRHIRWLTVTNWPLTVPPIIYGIMLPLLANTQKIATHFERLGLVLPQLSLAPGFALGVTFIIIDIDFFEEIGECIIYLSFMLSLIDPWHGQSKAYPTEPFVASRILPTKLFAAVFILAVLLSLGVNAAWSPLTSTGLVYVHLDYADTFYDYELYDDAAAQFRLVVAIRPRFVFARHQLIRSLLRSGDHAEAAEAVREAVKLAPLSPSLENELKSHGIVW
jgi:hypothetical protein